MVAARLNATAPFCCAEHDVFSLLSVRDEFHFSHSSQTDVTRILRQRLNLLIINWK